MEKHRAVVHPRELVLSLPARRVSSWNDKALDFATNRVLASRLLFNALLVLPLLALPLSKLQSLVVILSSNWLQAWALPALQRSSNKQQALQDAKADTDHQTLTYIAHAVDEIRVIVDRPGIVIHSSNTEGEHEHP